MAYADLQTHFRDHMNIQLTSDQLYAALSYKTLDWYVNDPEALSDKMFRDRVNAEVLTWITGTTNYKKHLETDPELVQQAVYHLAEDKGVQLLNHEDNDHDFFHC